MEERDLKPRKYKKGILFTFLLVVIIVICIFSIFTSVKVVGGSMEPNYNGGENGVYDKVIISRIYGLKYGDVVVFKSEELGENLIKRVVGLEGDNIKFIAGKLYRNNQVVEENYIKEDMNLAYDGRSYDVKKGEVFVLGDNRNNSTDSRELGPIKKKSIIGEVIIRVNNANGKIYFI